MRCQRCGLSNVATTMSMFNTQEICLACEKNERTSPRYNDAVNEEREQVRRGNMNFGGVGR